MTPCSICLGDVRETRSNKPTRCGHLFHGECLNKWKLKGKNTCPLCRKLIDVSTYSVTIKIENNMTGMSSESQIDAELLDNIVEMFEIGLEFEDRIDIESLFADIGAMLSNEQSQILTTDAT
jgi:hypothetical protein